MTPPNENPHQRQPGRAHLSDVPLASEEAQRGFFAAALAGAVAAERRSGVVERWFEVAGAALRLSFAGEALMESLAPALADLAMVPAAHADATFHIWDSESTGIAMPPPICPQGHFTKRGDIWSMRSRRFKSACQASEPSLALMDVDTATGIFWAGGASALSQSTRAHPLLDLLHWWMESRGCQVIPGAGVGANGEGVLIAGGEEAARSTAAQACLDAGLEFLTRDYLVVKPGARPRLYSLYRTARLDAAAPARSLDLKAILMPNMSDRPRAALEPVDKRQLARVVGFATLTQLPHAGRHTLDFIERLAAGLPAFRLDLGADSASIAQAVTSFLSRPPDPAARAGAAPADRPRVSVIIPVRNGASFLPEAIASIEAQHYPAMEIIVVDDGSTEDIQGALGRLSGPIRYVRQEPLGPSAARNRGIREAAGELIAFLDVDDLWPPDNLGLMVDAIGSGPSPGGPPWDVVQGYPQIMRRMPDTGDYACVGNPLESFPD